MAIGHLVTRGYGNGTLTATVAFVVTRGYSIGEAVEPEPDYTPTGRASTRRGEMINVTRSGGFTTTTRAGAFTRATRKGRFS